MIILDVLYLFLLILFIPLNLKVLFRPEYRKLIRGRFSPKIKPEEKKSIWVHAVSVGEVRSLLSFVSRLRKETDHRIVLSVTTPSGLRIANEMFNGIDIVNGPVDLSFVIRKFIRKINPEIIILNELEIWPNWISVSHKKKIPMVVINGRISEKAFERYKKFSFFFRKYFNRIDLFLLQGANYSENFIQLGVDPASIKVCGNIKADEALEGAVEKRSEKEVYELINMNQPQKKVLLFASTHSTDEDIFVPVLEKVIEKYFVIIAPRHMNRISEVADELKKREVPFYIWSRARGVSEKKGVMIFDKMGYLTDLMNISGIVFMGGSFDPAIGGHNLYEPAALGKKIIGGPRYNNFPSIGEELTRNGVYTVINTTAELVKFLTETGEKSIEFSEHQGIRSVRSRSGATDCTLQEVKRLIN